MYAVLFFFSPLVPHTEMSINLKIDTPSAIISLFYQMIL